MTTKKAKLSCPECGAKYDTAKGMSSHRRNAHGVAGSSKNTLAAKALKEAQMKLPPAVPLVEAAPFRCEECKKIFDDKKDLGLHRLREHGIKGHAKSSITAQHKREAYLANYKRNAEGLLICPECDQGFNEKGIANHRRQTHHISAAAQVAMFENDKIVAKIETIAETPDPLKCPHCEFVAANQRGMYVHIGSKHKPSTTPAATYKREKRNKTIDNPTQALTVAETNGNVTHTEETHPAGSGYTIPDATLALALGRFQGLCQSISVEFDLPPRLFASRLAELIYHSQVRTPSRSGLRVPTL